MGLETGETQPATSQQEIPKTHKNQGFWERLVSSGLRRKLIIPYMLLTLLLAIVGTFVVTKLVASNIAERFSNRLKEAGQVSADAIARQERDQLANLRSMVFTTGAPDAVAAQDADALNDLLYPLLVNNKQNIMVALNASGQEFISLAF